MQKLLRDALTLLTVWFNPPSPVFWGRLEETYPNAIGAAILSSASRVAKACVEVEPTASIWGLPRKPF
jgi:hypothetical protein